MTTIYSPLYEQYKADIKAKLKKDLGLKNDKQVPSIEKISVNIGMGSYLHQVGTKDYSVVLNNLTNITGRKPIVRKARMSVSNFKLREGMPVGVCVTLRGVQAFAFLEKVINIVYPRVQGFRGVSEKVFDKDGNASFGFSDCSVFPEIRPGEHKPHGLQITVVTTTKDPSYGEALLRELKFPFRKK